MTREEAREALQEQIDKYGQEYDDKGIEALEMAIKALEFMDKLSKRDIERFNEMEYTKGYNKGWKDGRKALEQHRKVGREREKHDSIELFGAMALLAGTMGAFGNDKKQMEAIPGGMLFSEKLRQLQEDLQAEISMNLLDSLKGFVKNSEEEDVDEE